MRIERVEIYSEESSRVVIRHPSRRYPGILVQGDDLASLCNAADSVCESVHAEGREVCLAEEAVGRLLAGHSLGVHGSLH
ncbi:MAG: DUF6959 family protein [Rhizomicrobium sp.]